MILNILLIKYDSYYDYKVDDINTLIYNLFNKK